MAHRFSTALGLVFAALLATVSVHAQAVGLIGFRGVAWGEGVARLQQPTLVSQQGEVRCYTRGHENLMFGKLPLREVRYCFVRDQLFSVMLESPAPAVAFAAQIAQIYGEPAAVRGTRSIWGGDADDTARIELVGSPNRDTQLMFVSAPAAARLSL